MKAITRRPAADAPPPARRPVRWGGRLLSVAAFVLAASILVPSAQAATGDLRYDGCIGDLAGCTPTSPAGALDGAAAVAVTPGGTDLYAASHTGDDVSHFRIDTAGNLIFAGCIGNLTGCTPVTANALDGADAVAISGANLYVAADNGEDVSHFRIDPAGNLTFAGCIGNLAGCTPVTANALNAAVGHSATPSGTDLYAASRLGNVISHFRIDSAGNLIFAGCIGGLAGCTPITPHVLDNALGLAVTRDSAHLYAAAFLGNAVSHFTIAPLSAARH